MSDALSEALDQALQTKNLLQNKYKAVSLVTARGPGAQGVVKHLLHNKHGLNENARYLGPILNWQGSLAPE
eukprot:12379841-Karenia_brevis.AAC.1